MDTDALEKLVVLAMESRAEDSGPWNQVALPQILGAQLHFFLALQLWADYLAALCLSFPICKQRVL